MKIEEIEKYYKLATSEHFYSDDLFLEQVLHDLVPKLLAVATAANFLVDSSHKKDFDLVGHIEMIRLRLEELDGGN